MKTVLVMVAMVLPAEALAANCARQPARCDSDLDTLNNAVEASLGTSAYDSDTDDDGLGDGVEVNSTGTDPLLWDTDGDTLGDGDEVNGGSDPLVADLDLDENGVEDALEVVGGPSVASLAPADLEVIVCDWDLVGEVALTNPNCWAETVTLDAGGAASAQGWPGEWAEGVDGQGSVTVELGFPDLATASQRLVGVEVVSGGATACYAGMVQARGATTVVGGGTTYWWFDTGRWEGCVP